MLTQRRPGANRVSAEGNSSSTWRAVTGVLLFALAAGNPICGAEPEAGLGERHEPETHLIPLMLRAIQTGQPITLFGDDYPTPDGTCIRDYIHVSDLAQAHILAVEHLLGGGGSEAFNVGTGTGHSVLEVLQAVERVTGQHVPHAVGPRREGDPPSLVADSQKLQHSLGWTPKRADLDRIVGDAWQFATRHPG